MTTPTTSWLERQLAEFEHASEARTQSILTGMAVTARELYPDPRPVYDDYIQQIVAQQNDVDKELIVETAEVAWTAALDKPVFVPLDLEGHTTGDVTGDSTVRPVCISTRESVVVPPRAKRAYLGILAHARKYALPRTCVGMTLRTLAQELGYTHFDKDGVLKPDHSRAAKDIQAAVGAQIIAVLDRGVSGEAGGLSGLYCLRASGEDLEVAVAHGQLQREYLRRRALLNNGLVDEPMATASPAADQPVPAPLPAAVGPFTKFEAQVDRMIAELAPPHLSLHLHWKWDAETLRELFEAQPYPLAAVRSRIKATVAEWQPVGAPF